MKQRMLLNTNKANNFSFLFVFCLIILTPFCGPRNVKNVKEIIFYAEEHIPKNEYKYSQIIEYVQNIRTPSNYYTLMLHPKDRNVKMVIHDYYSKWITIKDTEIIALIEEIDPYIGITKRHNRIIFSSKYRNADLNDYFFIYSFIPNPDYRELYPDFDIYRTGIIPITTGQWIYILDEHWAVYSKPPREKGRYYAPIDESGTKKQKDKNRKKKQYSVLPYYHKVQIGATKKKNNIEVLQKEYPDKRIICLKNDSLYRYFIDENFKTYEQAINCRRNYIITKKEALIKCFNRDSLLIKCP